MENNVKFKSYWLKKDVDDETYINRVVYNNGNGKDEDCGNGDAIEDVKKFTFKVWIGFAGLIGLFLSLISVISTLC